MVIPKLVGLKADGYSTVDIGKVMSKSQRSLFLPDKGTTNPILILLFAEALEIKNIINNSSVKNLIRYFI